jgi:hypothetical protein
MLNRYKKQGGWEGKRSGSGECGESRDYGGDESGDGERCTLYDYGRVSGVTSDT